MNEIDTMLFAKFKWKQIICKSFKRTGKHSLSKVDGFTRSFTQKIQKKNFQNLLLLVAESLAF